MESRDLALWWLTECPNLGWAGWRQVLAKCDGSFRAGVFGQTQEHYERVWGLPSRLAKALAGHGPITAEVSAPVSGLPIRFIAESDSDYPEGLRRLSERPPIISSYGSDKALAAPVVAIVCSRGYNRDDLTLVKAAADAALDGGYALVAGHNKPPYQLALLAAKRRAQHSVMALDRGILAAFEDDLRRDPLPAARIWGFEFDRANSVAISPFRLRDPWIGANSRVRDAIVIALADAVLVVHVRPGGVMAGLVVEAVQRGQAVFADEGSLEMLGDCGVRPWEGAWIS